MTEKAKPLKKIVPEKVNELNQSQKASQGEECKGSNGLVLSQKRTKMIADKENSAEETKTESKISVDGEERKIIKAKRRFAGSEEAGKDDTTHDENSEVKRGKFILKSSFAEVSG